MALAKLRRCLATVYGFFPNAKRVGQAGGGTPEVVLDQAETRRDFDCQHRKSHRSRETGGTEDAGVSVGYAELFLRATNS